jgi:hypothetical protein
MAPAEELQASVKKLAEDHPEGWIIDGNYEVKLGETETWLEELTTDVICMGFFTYLIRRL